MDIPANLAATPEARAQRLRAIRHALRLFRKILEARLRFLLKKMC